MGRTIGVFKRAFYKAIGDNTLSWEELSEVVLDVEVKFSTDQGSSAYVSGHILIAWSYLSKSDYCKLLLIIDFVNSFAFHVIRLRHLPMSHLIRS